MINPHPPSLLSDRDAEPHARAVPAVIAAWLIGLATLVFIRFRVSWTPYVAFHKWLHDLGVPDGARRLDYTLLMLLPVAIGALLLRWRAGVAPARAVLLQRPRAGWVGATGLAAAPAVLGGAVLMLARHHQPLAPELIGGVVRAPILEELFLRGLLVGLPLVALDLRGRAFWSVAAVAAVVFGFMHIQWSAAGLASGWPNLLVTAGGGIWFAWLMRSWRSIVVPMFMHAAMNLCWILAGVSDAGGGGLAENGLRFASIAIATVATLRSLRCPRP
ncbi:MAG: CPBP family intramembrane metalloprotease [Phycisphaeraceae bacterium]|nr:MAG: CPBP family intramembrane metalloprotease [Phycisphaeraceae bacterium]